MGSISRFRDLDMMDYLSVFRQQESLSRLMRDSYEERQLRQDLNRNHRELMSEVKSVGKNILSVTVVASEISASAEHAERILSDLAKDYDLAKARWDSRISRVRKWQEKRKERKKKLKLEAEIASYIEMNLPNAQSRDAQAYVIMKSTWFRPFPYEDALRYVIAGSVPTPNVDELMKYKPRSNPYDRLWAIHDPHPDWMCKSRPLQPPMYGSLAAIREVATAAKLTPSAMLTIPSPTVQAIAALCHD